MVYTQFFMPVWPGELAMTSDKDGWSMVTTNAEAAKDFVETHNVTRWLVHVGELAGVKNAEEYLKR